MEKRINPASTVSKRADIDVFLLPNNRQNWPVVLKVWRNDCSVHHNINKKFGLRALQDKRLFEPIQK